MPVYEYACSSCDHHFDVRHSAEEKPTLTCPQCQGEVRKVFFAAGIIFKGSGWHITDYASKGNGSGNGSGTPTDEKPAAATTSKTETETKPVAKPETAAVS